MTAALCNYKLPGWTRHKSELPDECWQNSTISHTLYSTLAIIYRLGSQLMYPFVTSSERNPVSVNLKTSELLMETNFMIKYLPKVCFSALASQNLCHNQSRFQSHRSTWYTFVSFIFLLSMYLARLCWNGHFKAGAKLRTLLFLYYVKL